MTNSDIIMIVSVGSLVSEGIKDGSSTETGLEG